MSKEDIIKQITVMIYKSFFDYRDKINDEDLKNYFLGFVFYKYISNKMERFADVELNIGNKKYNQLDENSDEGKATLDAIKKSSIKKLGYFIRPSDLINQVCQFNDDDVIVGKVIFDLQNAFMRIGLSTVGQESEDALLDIFSDILAQNKKILDQENDKNVLIRQILCQICAIDFSSEADVMGEVFENLIEQYNEVISRNKHGGIQVPQKIRNLLAKIVSSGKTQLKNVYDPTCSTGSLLLSVIKDFKVIDGIYGQEINQTAYNLCRMNMIMHNVPYKQIDIKTEDSLERPKHLGNRFEAIVAIPPFSFFMPNNSNFNTDDRFVQNGGFVASRSADFSFIQHMLHHLDQKGTMASVFPQRILYCSGKEGRIRKYLIEERNAIAAVIGLPANTFYGTSILTCILVLKLDRKYNEGIHFINANKFIENTKTSKNLGAVDIEKIITSYQTLKIEDNFSYIASINEIRNNNFNLNIAMYVDPYSRKLKELDDKGDLINLGSLVELVRGENELFAGVKVLSTKNLSKIITEPHLNISGLEKQDHSKNLMNYKKIELKKGDIIIKTVWGELQPTIYNEVKPLNVLVLKGNLEVLRPKNSNDTEFIYFQLHTQRVIKQIEMNANGTIQRRISIENLKSIKLPNMTKEQKQAFLDLEKFEIISKQEEKLIGIKNVLAVKSESEEEEFQFIRFLCHDLKPKLAKIKVDTVALKDYIESKGLLNELSQEALTNEDKPKTNGELANGVVQTIEHMSKLLDNIRALSTFAADEYQKTDFNLEKLFNEYFTPNFQADINFEIKVDIPKKIKLKIYEPLFIEAFNNIFRNAIIHGKKVDQNKITVKIDAGVDKENRKIRIIYSNDGNKLPENLTEKSFTTFGNKGKNSPGDGLGGAYIGKVLKIHNADFFIDKNSIYPVCFIFTFPIEEVL